MAGSAPLRDGSSTPPTLTLFVEAGRRRSLPGSAVTIAAGEFVSEFKRTKASACVQGNRKVCDSGDSGLRAQTQPRVAEIHAPLRDMTKLGHKLSVMG